MKNFLLTLKEFVKNIYVMFLIFQFLKYHFLALEVRIDVSVKII